MKWILFFSMATLCAIVFADFKNRMIPLIFFLAELVFSLWIGFENERIDLIQTSVLNLSIIAIQILALVVWTRIKNKNSRLWDMFGAGDLFMLLICGLNFPPFQYAFFVVIVCITVLVFWLAKILLHQIKESSTIPFAGFLALGLICLRIFQLLGKEISFFHQLYY